MLRVAHRAPPSMGFPRQEYWSRLSFPPPGDLPDPGIEPASPPSPALAGGFFTPPARGKGHEEGGSHTQRRDRASGVPLDILEHLPPKAESAYFTALCSHLCFLGVLVLECLVGLHRTV